MEFSGLTVSMRGDLAFQVAKLEEIVKIQAAQSYYYQSYPFPLLSKKLQKQDFQEL